MTWLMAIGIFASAMLAALAAVTVVVCVLSPYKWHLLWAKEQKRARWAVAADHIAVAFNAPRLPARYCSKCGTRMVGNHVYVDVVHSFDPATGIPQTGVLAVYRCTPCGDRLGGYMRWHCHWGPHAGWRPD